ncbi:MAG TPA: tetratricopeptide repeat protein [Stellaceae bacterium]|nr:tetratricopeptide repeat protein [Stellaceae bacterium]
MDGLIEYPLYRPDEMIRAAWAAMSRQDHDAALQMWQALREHSPELADGHVWPLQILWQIGRLDEAEAMAAKSAARFPDHPELSVQRAWIATMQRRWDEAAERWAAVRRHAPERLEGYVSGARALWQSGRFDHAETVAAEGVRRFPGDIEAMAEHGWTATTREDWPQALRRWTLVHNASPERIDAQARLIQALRMTGRLDDSEAMLTAALAAHPDEPDLVIEHIWAAVAREDWPNAAARLAAARRDPQNATRIAEIVEMIEPQIRDYLAAAPEPPAADIADDGDMPPRELMLGFESLGERCDFGAVQRHYGVEPLGLLRFAWSKLDHLVAALEDRFAAIGTVEDTDFGSYGDETILRMKKYNLIFHTFVEGVAAYSPEKREAFERQQRRRLVFLKDKLVRDLEDPQKICVYATDDFGSNAEMMRLFAALRAYGPNSLLYVRPERADRPAGTVERLKDGLYAGYFSGLADFVGGHQPPFELWQRLCRQTHRLANGA